jgi:hypothetical protein
MASPAAPVLKVEGSKVTVSFDVPAAASVAVVYLISSRNVKFFYDAEKKWLLAPGKTGKVISLATKGAGRTSVKSKSVEVLHLLGGVAYTATVSFRGADDFDFGPTSPASAPLTLVPPVAPQAPRLEPVSQTEVKVHFVAPPDCVNVDIFLHDITSGAREWRVLADGRLGLPCSGKPYGSSGTGVVVKGLASGRTYKVSLEAHNGSCWGPRGPWSKPLTLADHVPEPPCAPLLDKITQDSVRVRCALMEDCTDAGIFFKQGNTRARAFDSVTRTLVVPGTGKAVPAPKAKAGEVVTGLQPDTEYEVYYTVANAFGWGAVPSPSSKFRTRSDVEITGARTQEARDAELRKHAIDVDALDPAPAAKRPKKEK